MQNKYKSQLIILPQLVKKRGQLFFNSFIIFDWPELLHYNDVQDIEMAETQVKPGILIEAYTEQIEITVDNFTAAWKETGLAVFQLFYHLRLVKIVTS